MHAEIQSLGDLIYWTVSGSLNIVFTVLFSCLIGKKKHFGIRLTLYLTVFLVFLVGLELKGYIYYNEDWMFWILQLFSVAVFFVCSECSLKEIVYLKIWAIAFDGFLAQLPGLIAGTIAPDNMIPVLKICKYISAAAVIVMAYFTFKISIRKGIQAIGWADIVLSGVVTALVTVFNSQLFRRMAEASGVLNGNMIFLLEIFSSLCVLLILYMQVEINCRKQIERDRELMERIFLLEKKNFEERQSQIDLINRKCHDLKHQIAALEKIHDEQKQADCIQELKDAVMVYDDSMHTGNLALETILMEKKLQYEEKEVLLNCIVDGISLEFIDIVDLYILLGNILDNALECVQDFGSRELRMVELRIFRDKNMIRLIERNYLGKVLWFENGLPVTTKEKNGDHGFGCQSIRHIVQKYQGDMIIDAGNQCFEMKIMIPLPHGYRIGAEKDR